MLDLKRLRVLREVAARGSFSGAADALSYTQSAVSQQIAALEREAGTRLVERNPRGIRLTDAGEALVRHTDTILARLSEAEAELDAIAGLRGGRLRLGSFPTAGASLMPAAIATFSRRHPGVELSLVEAEPDESVPRLRAGELDIVLVFDASPASDDFEEVHLLDDPLHLALSRDHPLAGRRRPKLADFMSEPWVQSTSGCPCSQYLSQACRSLGFEPHVAFESDDYQVVQGLVAAGVGVALIPELALASVHPDVVIRSLGAQAPVRRITAAALTGGYRSPATAAMLEILRETAASYGSRRLQLAQAS